MFPSIPARTVRAARALYGRGNLYLRLGDRLNQILARFDPEIISMHRGEDKAVLLALLTVIQYVEKLTDVELAESIQQRMDLRYALHLATPSIRLDPDSLCAFRSSILTDAQCRGRFEEVFKSIYPEIISTAMKEEPNINDVLNSICENEILASLVEAMHRSIEALSANHFNWLRRIALPFWYQRYNRSLVVTSQDASIRKRELTREDVQGDIQHLFYEIHESNSRNIMEMHEIKELNLIWEQLTDSKSTKNCNHCINRIHRKEVQIRYLQA